MYFLVFLFALNRIICILLQANQNIYTVMKVKNSRLEALKMLISSMELSSQEEVLKGVRERRIQTDSGNIES